MKRNVIIVGTLFNLLQAVHIKYSMYKDAVFDIVLISTQEKIESIYKTGVLNNIFDRVYYINLNEYNEKKMLALSVVFPNYVVKKMLKKREIPKWDDIFFWNPEYFLYSYLWMCEKKKWNYMLHMYGDAIAGYIKDCPCQYGLFKNSKINTYVMHRYGFYFMGQKGYDIYLFKPEYICYETKRKLVEIPLINTNDSIFIALINKIFHYEAAKCYIKEKYIFFDDVWGELDSEEDRKELITSIRKCVGKENFIVKPHPRGSRACYVDLGVTLFEEIIPWEVVCINNNIQDKVFITTVSSAAIMPIFLFGTFQKVYIVNYLKSKVEIENMEKTQKLYVKINETGLGSITIFNERKTLISKLNCED